MQTGGAPSVTPSGLAREQCEAEGNDCSELEGPHTARRPKNRADPFPHPPHLRFLQVCLEITLNNDPEQRTTNCVPFTYFDE